MKLQVFAVFDKAVASFLPPFFVRSKGEALRSFTDACADEKHQFRVHAADFSLMQLGEWDDQSGIMVPCDPQRIVSAYEVLPDDPFTEENRADQAKVKRLPM